MRVMIIGGTGLLGYHTSLELIKRGQVVEILSLFPCQRKVYFILT